MLTAEAGLSRTGEIDMQHPSTRRAALRCGLFAGAALAALLMGGAGAAAAEAPGPTTLSEIVVTAEKRTESLLTTSLSISAISGDALEGKSISTLADLQTVVPGLSVSSTNLLIRGIGNNVLTADASPGVALHTDGVYLGRQYAVLDNFYDIERVEVLRGPQGTLYGRNATGGVVNIISRRPTAAPEGYLEGTVGNYESRDIRAALGGPISEGVQMRAAFLHNERKGRIPNLFAGRPAADDRDETAARLLLAAQLSDRLQLDLKLDAAKADDHGLRTLWQAVPIAGSALPSPRLFGGVVPDLAAKVVNLNSPISDHFRAWGATARIAWETDAVTLSSISAYRRTRFSTQNDFDGSPISYGYLSLFKIDQDQWSQELNLASKGTGPLTWVAGAYLYKENVDNPSQSELPVFGLKAPVVAKLETNSYAIFGQATYSLAEHFDLTAGARYSVDDKSIYQAGNQFGRPLLDDVSNSWHAFTPRATLTYRGDGGWIAYATVSRGFKSGGFNVNVAGALDFDPETVWNYELGAKGSWLNGRLELSGAAFRMNYNNLQVFSFTGISSIIQNAAKATIRGVEVEGRALPLGDPNFEIGFAATYLDAKYDQFNYRDDLRGVTTNVGGNRLENSPRFKVNLRAKYRIDLRGLGSVTPMLSYTHQDRVFFRPLNDRIFSQGGFELMDLTIDYLSVDQHWSASAFLRNATNKTHTVSSSLITATQVRTVGLGEPRTVGVRLGYRF